MLKRFSESLTVAEEMLKSNPNDKQALFIKGDNRSLFLFS